MKLKLILFFSVFAFSSTLFASSNTPIETAFASCSYKELATYFSENIELSILEKENTYSKTQAELIVKSFFVKNHCTGFAIIHSGAAKGDSKYVIGQLTTDKGEFRVYYVIKNNKILELSIEEE